MRPRTATAFAPAAITNFFSIRYDRTGRQLIGATGGGYVLSRGVTAKASLYEGEGTLLSTSVNGDKGYDARTTRRAMTLLMEGRRSDFGRLSLDQEVDVPIGAGFGASAASAISAVLAASSVLGIRESERALAMFAHRGEILEQTGLGTVSVTYFATGAGAITTAGKPGVAEFFNVRVPKGTRIVTAYLAPYDKRNAISSKSVSGRINRLGDEALREFLADPTFEVLAEQGETFSRLLGLETPEVRKLETVAKTAGATHSSQNMIGYAVHAVADEDTYRNVAIALEEMGKLARVDVFEVGSRPAGLEKPIRR